MSSSFHSSIKADGVLLTTSVVAGNIANPMSKFEEYRHSRLSWGIGVLGSLFVIITASDGTQGYATGFGGPPACWLIEEHLKRFLIGKDPRDTNLIWDQVRGVSGRKCNNTELSTPRSQMYRASMFYGRKGIAMLPLSVLDLALWDLLGKIRGEPVHKMIGGATKTEIPLYLTGPLPVEAKRMGFWGGKVGRGSRVAGRRCGVTRTDAVSLFRCPSRTGRQTATRGCARTSSSSRRTARLSARISRSWSTATCRSTCRTLSSWSP